MKGKENMDTSYGIRILRGFSALFASLVFFVTATEAQTTVIATFGDSITQGYPLTPEAGNGSRTGGYQPYLDSFLNSDGFPAVVLNYGRGSENTNSGVGRIGSVISASSPGIILILEGTNDIHIGISFERTIKNLRTMVDISRQRGVRPIIATLTPNNTLSDPNVIPGKYNPAIINMAREKGVVVANQWAAVSGNWGALSADGLHPNSEGYKAIARMWQRAISAKEPAPPSPVRHQLWLFRLAGQGISLFQVLCYRREFIGRQCPLENEYLGNVAPILVVVRVWIRSDAVTGCVASNRIDLRSGRDQQSIAP